MLTWKFHTGPVYGLAFTPDGRLLTCSSDRLIRLWDLGSQTELRRWACEKGTFSLAVSPDGRFVGWGGEREVTVWQTEGSRQPLIRGKGCWAVAFSPSGKRFVAVGSGWSESAWSLPSGKPLSLVAPMEGDDVAYHPDGRTLATSVDSYDEEENGTSCVRLLVAATGRELAVLTPSKPSEHGGPLVFSPDGRWLASLHAEAVVVWDVESRTEVARRAPNRKEMKGVAFTADGRRLLTAGHDELVRVWAAPNWEEVTSYAWKIGRIKSLAVSPDGTLAAAGGDRGKVMVWDLD
jgi:WD40 repeat protein